MSNEVVAIEIGSQQNEVSWGRKCETKSRQVVAVRHSGKKSYFDMDSLPTTAMILKERHRFRTFDVSAVSDESRPAASSEPPTTDLKG